MSKGPMFIGYSEFKQVGGGQLDQMIGWDLLAVLNVSFPEVEEVTQVTPGHTCSNDRCSSWVPETVATEKVVTPNSHPVYLFGRREESVLADLKAERDKLQIDVVQMGEMIEEKDKELAAARKSRDDEEGRSEGLNRRLEDAYKGKREAESRARTMETDIGKVRQAIGDDRWTEIVE